MSRRLSASWAAMGSPAPKGTPVKHAPNLLGINEDEAELESIRARRKSNAAALTPVKVSKENAVPLPNGKNAISLAALTGKVAPIAAGAGGAALSNDQLADLYSACIKMSTENKINTKNTWDLSLIDYMNDMLDDDSATNFQKASCTIDAGVKIFSTRVDSIHTETFKVLGGLTRTQRKDGDDDEAEAAGSHGEGAEGDEYDPDAEKAKKTRKRAKRAVKTLETSFAPLNVKKYDLEFDVDPLFHKTSAAFDEGGARGLLLNQLGVSTTGQLIFDSTDTVGTAGSDQAAVVDSSESQDAIAGLASLIQPAGASALESAQLCPAFSAFVAANWEGRGSTGASDWAVGATPRAGDESDDDSHGGFDLGFDDGAWSDGSDFDADALFGAGPGDAMFGQEAERRLRAELDEDEEDASNTSRSGNSSMASGRGVGGVADLIVGLAEAGNEFYYFDPAMLKNWAGPNHWKFSKASKSKAKKDGKKKRKKEKFSIDFHTAGEVDTDVAFSVGKSKNGWTLSKATLSKQSNGALTLPPDAHYEVGNLSRFSLRPKFTVRARRDRHGGAGGFGGGSFGDDWGVDGDDSDDDGDFGDFGFEADDGGWYNYDNPNDNENFTAGAAGGSLWGADGPNAGAGVGGSLALVDEPDKVAKIDINYAKVAKQVNVKRLKGGIWNKLTQAAPGGRVEEKEDTKTRKTKAVTVEMGKEVEVKFSDLLPGIEAEVDKSTAEDVSFPFCFICLLHLANEHNLKITATDDMAELIVSQDG